MSTTVYLIVSLLLAGFSFYVLYTGKLPFIRMPSWVVFYLSMIILSMLWVSFFFPQAANINVSMDMVLWSKACSVSFVFGGFFLWVYLRNKNSEISIEKVTKNVAKFFTILAIVFIILISLISLVLRYYE